MRLRCTLTGHQWGQLSRENGVTLHTCTRCGRTKSLKGIGGGPADDQRFMGGGGPQVPPS